MYKSNLPTVYKAVFKKSLTHTKIWKTLLHCMIFKRLSGRTFFMDVITCLNKDDDDDDDDDDDVRALHRVLF